MYIIYIYTYIYIHQPNFHQNRSLLLGIARKLGGSAVASAFNSLLTERILKGDKALDGSLLFDGS